MTATSFQIFVLAVLAIELIDDLGLSRAELGLIGSINTATGALSAPFTGRLTDRIGAWNATIAGMVISAAGLAVMAVSPNAVVLSLSALIAGVPQGWGNPATNALIAERVDVGARGTVTGIKQSGVQFGVFLSGFTLPSLAVWFGWRGAVAAYAAAFVVGAGVTAVCLPKTVSPKALSPGTRPAVGRGDGPDADETGRADGGAGTSSQSVDPWIWRLAVYALLMGLAGGVIGRFFPLWAEESIGLSTARAGLLVALTGLLGIGARIIAGQVAEDRIPPPRLLQLLAAVGGAYSLLLLATPLVGSWILWPGTAFNAVGIGAWNAVAMLAIIMVVPSLQAGRASGVVILGFLGGLSISAPIAGWVVDRWGSYQPVWAACVALTVLAVVSLSSPSSGGRGDSSTVAVTPPR